MKKTMSEMEWMAHRFVKKNDIQQVGPGKSEITDSQLRVVEEEMDEFLEAYDEGDMGEIAEEAADVAITMFIICEQMGISLQEAYMEKMLYNLGKSGVKDGEGKVIDDSNYPKPDFNAFVK